jgi:S1-C subfamily serine protease
MKKTLLLITILAITTFAQNLPTSSVVQVFASLSIPNYQYPWQTSQRSQVSGSGMIIQDDYIITNAHVISDAKYIQLSKENDSKKYTASVEYVSHQADLALLKVKNREFYKNTSPLQFTENVKIGDNITVLGYPIGGSSLSTTKGVVSRIESNNYVWSAEHMLAIQVDAAVNSGNSGGAALDDENNIVGIVMQSYSKNTSDNIRYIIPSLIVKTFLDDIKDGIIDGFDDGATYYNTLLNPAKKEYYGITTNQGVIVSKIQENEDAFKEGDILLEVEGNVILNDGKVNTQYGLQSVDYFENIKSVGEKIDYKIKRGNEILNIKYTLKRKKEIIKKEFYKEPRYLIFGGFVFAPLTKNYLNLKKLHPVTFENFYELKHEAKDVTEGVIIQAEKFDHSVNEGYYPYIYLIHTVNGTQVKNFQHFVKLIDESNEKYTIIDFLDAKQKYVIDTKKAKESFEEIKNIYGLDKDRRL